MEKKILVVDDDPYIIKGLQILLRNAGYTVELVQKGQEVVPHATTFMPDIILLDVMLGGMDGREITQTLKSDPKTKNIPIILISANQYMQQDYKQYGAETFISKPFESSHLLKIIDKHAV
jgi:CheY-like chemotaxis protein